MMVSTSRTGPVQAFVVWAVYRHPSDYPTKYVARRWFVHHGQTQPDLGVLMADDLDGVRRMLPPGLMRMRPFPNDDPAIVETWM